MTRIKLTQFICNLLPPLISQRARNILYPITLAREQNINYTKKSITGTPLSSNTLDYHGYRFLFHGFFDWRNIIVANSIFKFDFGDIIEIGANIGTETVSFIDIVSLNGKVHAFEPLPDNIKHLKKLSKNNKNLILYQHAISNQNGEASFLVPSARQSGSGKILLQNLAGKEKIVTVKTSKLDDFNEVFNKIRLISIDTEGHEPMVLEGSKGVLKKFRPCVIIEVSPNLLAKYASSNPENIYNFFDNLDYDVFVINKLAIKLVSKTDLETKKPSNWVCIPKEKKSIPKIIKKDLLLRSIIPWYLLRSLPTNQKVK